MATLQDIQKYTRDFERYTGDGLPNEPTNAPLPVGDPASGVYNPTKADIRELLTIVVQTLGDPDALDQIISQLAGLATLDNSGKIFGNRQGAVDFGQENLPSDIARIIVIEGDYLVIRGHSSTNDPLFGSQPSWGIVARFPSADVLNAFVGSQEVTLGSVGGTGNAITANLSTVAVNAGLESVPIGSVFRFRAEASNTSANPTLQAGTVTHNLRSADGSELPAGTLKAGQWYQFVRYGATTARLLSADIDRATLDEAIGQPFDAPFGYSVDLGTVNWTEFDNDPAAGEYGKPLAGWNDTGFVVEPSNYLVGRMFAKTDNLPDLELRLDGTQGVLDGEGVVGFLPDGERKPLFLYRKGTSTSKPGLDAFMSGAFWERARGELDLTAQLADNAIQIISESNQSLGTGGPFVAGATRSELLGRVDPASALMLGGMQDTLGTSIFTNGTMREPYDQTVPSSGLVAAEPRSTFISGSWPLATMVNPHRADKGLAQVPVLTTTHGYGGMLIEDMDADGSDGTNDTVVWTNLNYWYDEAKRVAAAAGKSVTVPWHDWLHGTSAKDYPQGQYYGLLVDFQKDLRAMLKAKGFTGAATFIMSQPGGDVNTVGENWWVCDEILDFCEAGAGVLATPEYAYEIADNSVHPDSHATAQMQECKALAIAHLEAGHRWTIGRPDWSISGNTLTLDFADIWESEYLVTHDASRYNGQGIDAFAGFQVDGATITGMSILGRRVTLTCSAPPTGVRYALQQQAVNGFTDNRWTAHRGLMRTSSSWPSKLLPGETLYRWLPSFRITF